MSETRGPASEDSQPFLAWPSQRVKWLAFALLLTVAAFLRLQNLSCMEFKNDEAENSMLALMIARGASFPAAGMFSSAGSQNPPFFPYLLSLPFLISRDPVVAAGFIALLNVVAVGLLWFLGRRIGGEPVAWFASVAFAVNPWAVFYARKIWQQDALAPFVVGYIYLSLCLAKSKKPVYLLAAALCFSLMTELHLTTIGLGVVLVCAAIHARSVLQWFHYLSAVLLFLLPYAPYLYYDALKHWENLNSILHGGRVAPWFQPITFLSPFQLVAASGFWARVPLAIQIVSCLALGAGVLIAVVHTRRVEIQMLLLWLVLPMVLVATGKMTFQQHYLLALMPCVVVFAGAGFAELLKRCERWRLAAAGVLMVFCVPVTTHLVCTLRFNYAVAQSSVIAWQQYGPPFRVQLRNIRKLIWLVPTSDPWLFHRALIARLPLDQSRYYYPMATQYILQNLPQIANW
jgi:hypothetical protein